MTCSVCCQKKEKLRVIKNYIWETSLLLEFVAQTLLKIPFCSTPGERFRWLQVLPFFFLYFPPWALKKQILSRRASWLGVAQWPHRHLGLRVCQSVTVCWSWSKRSSLFGVLCLKRLWPCRRFVLHWNLRPLLCFLSKLGFGERFLLPSGKACKCRDSSAWTKTCFQHIQDPLLFVFQNSPKLEQSTDVLFCLCAMPVAHFPRGHCTTVVTRSYRDYRIYCDRR